jgi:hypothetical protein
MASMRRVPAGVVATLAFGQLTGTLNRTALGPARHVEKETDHETCAHYLQR